MTGFTPAVEQTLMTLSGHQEGRLATVCGVRGATAVKRELPYGRGSSGGRIQGTDAGIRLAATSGDIPSLLQKHRPRA